MAVVTMPVAAAVMAVDQAAAIGYDSGPAPADPYGGGSRPSNDMDDEIPF